MKITKPLVIFIVLAVSLTPILSSFSISSSVNEESFNPVSSAIQESHLIEGVPYVSQETNIFCGFATPTMIFKYYGINTSLHEILYNAGVGYSLLYYTLANKSLPYRGWQISQDPGTCKFLADLYGLSYEPWEVDPSRLDEKRWNEEWSKIKQNITNDIPMAVYADASILAADNLGFGVFYPLLKSSPVICGHFILLIGFNEFNQTVCYNDPIYGFAGKPQYGTYRWVNLTKFKTSIGRVTEGLWIKMFTDTPETPLSKEEAFKISHKRNIERLKGNASAYGEEFNVEDEENIFLGINALNRLSGEFEKGVDHNIKTAYRYKLNNRMGIMYRLMNRIYSRYPQLFSFNLDKLILEMNDAYEDTAIEKKYTAEYLREIQDLLTDHNLSEICKHEAVLFEHEAENWTKLADYYSEFRERGLFMLLPRAILLINKMAVVMDNIISIEQAIIDGPGSS